MIVGRHEHEIPQSQLERQNGSCIGHRNRVRWGIAFYVRFLVSLRVERRRALAGMFVRLDTVAGDNPLLKRSRNRAPTPRLRNRNVGQQSERRSGIELLKSKRSVARK